MQTKNALVNPKSRRDYDKTGTTPAESHRVIEIRKHDAARATHDDFLERTGARHGNRAGANV